MPSKAEDPPAAERVDPPSPSECLVYRDGPPDESETRTFEGVVKKAKIEEPAVGPLTYSYLHLDEPMCLLGDAAETSIQDLQLVPDERGLFPPRGKRVRLTGTYFSQFNAHHVTKILLHDYAYEVVR